jgi:hypothetical protein
MTARARVALTTVSALVLGAVSYGHAYDVEPPGLLGDIWHASWIFYVFAIAAVFIVNRWWALLPAITPVAVTVYLHTATDYVAPWREESVGSDQPVLYVLLVLVAIGVRVAILSVGLLLRLVSEQLRAATHRRQ